VNRASQHHCPLCGADSTAWANAGPAREWVGTVRDVRNSPLGTVRARFEQALASRVIPGVLLRVGDLLGVIYRNSVLGQGKSENYVHVMDNPPVLATNMQGSQLYVLGGSYKVTPQGIKG
jgi:hypothetical protein